jgi:hypothetical protein
MIPVYLGANDRDDTNQLFEGSPQHVEADPQSNTTSPSADSKQGASQIGASSVAKVSLSLGISSLLFSILMGVSLVDRILLTDIYLLVSISTGILAISLAVITLLDKTTPIRHQSRRLAKAGLVAACFGISTSTIALFLFASHKTGNGLKTRSASNLHQIGIAFHNFNSITGSLPGNIFDKDGKPLLSWRVTILPYIEQNQLYNQFKLDEPWDSDHNKKLIERIPREYMPLMGSAKPGETYYQMFEGAWPQLTKKDGNVRLEMITKFKGLDSTGLVFEPGEPVIWSKPADMPFDQNQPLPKLGGIFNGESFVLMCNASVLFLRKDPDEEQMKYLIMWNSTNVVDMNKLER